MKVDTVEAARDRQSTAQFEDALDVLTRNAGILCSDTMEATGSDSCMLWTSRRQDTTAPCMKDLALSTTRAADEVFGHYFPTEARLTEGMDRIAHGLQFRKDDSSGLVVPRAIITIGRALPEIPGEEGEGNALSIQNLLGPGLLTVDGEPMSEEQIRSYSLREGINPGLIYGVEALAKLPEGKSPDVGNTYAHLFNVFGSLAAVTGVDLEEFSLYVELNEASKRSTEGFGVIARPGAYAYEGPCYFPVVDDITGLPTGEYKMTGTLESGMDEYNPFMIMGGRENSSNFELASQFLGDKAVYLLNGEVDAVRRIASQS
jgi:hypothetical protein